MTEKKLICRPAIPARPTTQELTGNETRGETEETNVAKVLGTPEVIPVAKLAARGTLSTSHNAMSDQIPRRWPFPSIPAPYHCLPRPTARWCSLLLCTRHAQQANPISCSFRDLLSSEVQ